MFFICVNFTSQNSFSCFFVFGLWLVCLAYHLKISRQICRKDLLFFLKMKTSVLFHPCPRTVCSDPQCSTPATIETEQPSSATSSKNPAASPVLTPHPASILLTPASALASTHPPPARPAPPRPFTPIAWHLGHPLGATPTSPAGGRRRADAHQR